MAKKRKYGKKAAAKVERTMREWKRGKLKTRGGRKVTSREQAIAIGLSQARAKGYKVPPAPSHATKARSGEHQVTLPWNKERASLYVWRGEGGDTLARLVWSGGANSVPTAPAGQKAASYEQALRFARQHVRELFRPIGSARR